MSGNKHFDRIAVVITIFMLLITVLLMHGPVLGITATDTTMGYENRLFDQTKVHTLDIVMNDWDTFIDQAQTEEYTVATVVIDGEAYKNVGIRAKGNTSLSTVSTLGSERYSFKIEFDHYDKSKSYYGLDKLSLNNLIQDATMMKDYLTYTMMQEFDVNASLCSYVYITVNGEEWGLYLAVEGVEDAFLERNYDTDQGELYKPDSLSFGGDQKKGFDIDAEEFKKIDFSKIDFSKIQGNKEQSKERGFDFQGGASGMSMGSSDVKLQYIDDDVSSYSNIWNNTKTDITQKDQERLIASLKALSDQEEIENVVDVEQVLRYFVVHNYVCNGDSYTGSMIHNYYLYEENGKLSMIPWDYNLAFGTFQGSNATSTINTPIDDPIEQGTGEDRPMWYWIVSDASYTEQYHEYFAAFLEEVDIQEIIENAYQLIREYVAKDPTAFYDYEAFEVGVETLRQFCTLRSESISKQLMTGETTQNMNYVDASDITLSDMGSMGMDSMGGGNMPDMPDFMPSMDNMPEMTNDFMGQFQVPQQDTNGETEQKTDEFQTQDGMQAPDNNSWQDGSRAEMNHMQMPDMDQDMQTQMQMQMQIPAADFSISQVSGETTSWIWIGISIIILLLGLIIAKKYKR